MFAVPIISTEIAAMLAPVRSILLIIVTSHSKPKKKATRRRSLKMVKSIERDLDVHSLYPCSQFNRVRRSGSRDIKPNRFESIWPLRTSQFIR